MTRMKKFLAVMGATALLAFAAPAAFATESGTEGYGGSNVGNHGGVWSSPEPYAGRPHRLSLRLPPLGAVFLKTPIVG